RKSRRRPAGTQELGGAEEGRKEKTSGAERTTIDQLCAGSPAGPRFFPHACADGGAQNQLKAAHVGFDWPHIHGLFEKLAEETAELQQQIEQAPPETLAPHSKSPMPEELC